MRWFESFLSLRTFTVVGPNGVSSKRQFGNRGVPQGSGLASLLFLLIIDALIHLLNWYCLTIAYADDRVLMVPGPCDCFNELIHRLQFCIRLLEDWSKLNGLTINPLKCSFLIFCNNAATSIAMSGVNVTIDDVLLHQQSTVKYLGLYIDSKLD